MSRSVSGAPLVARTVKVARAEPTGDRMLFDWTIQISEPIPPFKDESTYFEQSRAFHYEQAARLHYALLSGLPGGTLDQLFALMATERASVLRVPAPSSGGEAGGWPEQVIELETQRAAVLALHGPWVAVRRPELCSECAGDFDPVTWPCPTAQALGVTA